MVKVLYVSTSTTVGGAEKTLHALATRIDPRRFTVAGAVSLKPEGEYARRLSAEGIPVTSLRLTSLPGPSTTRALQALIEREKPDIVHAFMFSAIQLSRIVKGRSRVPFKLISSPRVNYRSRSWGSLLIDRCLKGRDDLLIAESDASRRFLLERLKYDPRKVSVVLNGVSSKPPPTAAVDRERKRSDMGAAADELLIGAVGRLDPQKGFAVLVEAMKRLKDLPLRCAIIGDGPQRQYLQDLVRHSKLDDKITLFGEQSGIVSWLASFDIYCLPSLWEGLPNSLLEAMSLGLPVVASAVDGVPEAVAHDRDGWLVPASSPEALASALRALANDPTRRVRLGSEARKTVAERFSQERMLQEYQRAYEIVASA